MACLTTPLSECSWNFIFFDYAMIKMYSLSPLKKLSILVFLRQIDRKVK
jgi:hypothetical protein